MEPEIRTVVDEEEEVDEVTYLYVVPIHNVF